VTTAVAGPLKAAVDWQSIETLYRAGALSIREIAKTHGLSDGAVRKRAKRDGWDRNLTAKVNAKVRSELVVRSEEVRTQDAVSERTMVEAAATTDWEAVEGMYRAGLLSIREIARSHGISHTAIQKRAKVDGWLRDLTAKVRQQVASGLVATEVATAGTATERQMVEAAATQVITLVREHRGQISRSRLLVDKLMAQLEGVADHRDLLEQIIDEVEDGSTGASIKRREALMRAVALPSNAGVLKNLADTLKVVIGLEREAFNVSAATSEPAAVDSDEMRFDRLVAKIRSRPKVIDAEVIDVTPTD
jgi:DNA-binding Lrp family transcriptional regulator